MAYLFHPRDPFSLFLLVKFYLLLTLENGGGRVADPTWTQLPGGLASRGLGVEKAALPSRVGEVLRKSGQ